MRAIRTLAACVALAAAFATPAQATGEEVLDLADAVLAQAVATTDSVTLPWDPLPHVTVRTFEHNTDYIVITDYGSGPTVSKVGAFSNPNWWACTTVNAGGPVSVQCTAKPATQSGISWKCDAMDVTAHALTNHRYVHRWTEDTLRDGAAEVQRTVNRVIGGGTGTAAAERAPSVGDVRWGQAAGVLACDNTLLETDTASQANPSRSNTGVFGMVGVTTFVCEARLARGVASAPIAPYSVNCLDPGAPGIE